MDGRPNEMYSNKLFQLFLYRLTVITGANAIFTKFSSMDAVSADPHN
jgi:hypothetical protein